MTTFSFFLYIYGRILKIFQYECRLLLACGDCTVDGGVYKGSYAVINGVANVIPVDYYIPGCPPTPMDILTGIRMFVDKVIQAKTGSNK